MPSRVDKALLDHFRVHEAPGNEDSQKNGIVRERMVYHTRRDAAANEQDKKLA